MNELAVSKNELVASLRYIRSQLYAAQAQLTFADDAMIARHVYDAYKRVSDICKGIELNGLSD